LALALFQAFARVLKWAMDRWRGNRPSVVEEKKIHAAVQQADESIIVIAKSRDALAADNERLRAVIIDTDAERARERAEGRAERAELRAEIDSLEQQLDSMEKQLENALVELRKLKEKHRLIG
jgi:septal ring factor EnvC (AmiA/AmiB activator)